MNFHHALIAPVLDDAYAKVTAGAHTGAYGANNLKTPSDAQAQAGIYKMGRVTVQGLRIAIEQPCGSIRSGKGADGKEWSSRMAAHYGYFEGTRGADGDGIDCFVGPHPESEQVFVINQRNPGGGFDEHKVMVGFSSERHARGAYMDSYERGWRGLQSLVPISLDQLRWWIKHGKKSIALTAESLPQQGTNPMNPKITWNEAQPDSISLDQVLYELRRMDGADGLLLDSVTMAEIMEDTDGVIALDALVVENAQLTRMAERLRAIMDRSGGEVKAPAVQVSDPFRARGVTNIAAVFELSDGQSVSVFFHNPDTAPNKLAPGDEMISWKWLLNKKDITIVVAPEKGQDLNPRLVASRIMKLAEKNSPAFQKANAKRSERMGNIEAIRGRIAEKEATLTELVAQVEAARLEKSQKTMQQEDTNAATREEVKKWLEGSGYAVKDAAMSQYTKTIGERVMFVTAAKLMLSAMLLDSSKLGSAALNPIAPDFKDALIPASDGATQPAMGYAAGFEVIKGFVEGREREGVTVLPAADPVQEDGDPIALVDAAYQFANATDAFKERVAGSIEETDYSPFASAKAMDMKAKSLGAEIHWGMGAALDGVSVAELGHAPAYTDGTGKWHSYTMEAMKHKDDAALRYIVKDATEAAEAGEKMGNPKAGQYRDEAHYASMEMQRRRKGGKQIMDSVVEDEEGDDDDFDPEAEFDACPVEDGELDGDFKGHPFRGNQHKKASSHSHAAVKASISAKHAEKDGDTKGAKSSHKSAHYSHMAAAEGTTGKARKYHRKMAKFHGGRAGMTLDGVEGWDDITLDAANLEIIVRSDGKQVGSISAEEFRKYGQVPKTMFIDDAIKHVNEWNKKRGDNTVFSHEFTKTLDDASDFAGGSIVGKIMQGGELKGRAVIGGDGKAMVFVGESNDQRVRFVFPESGRSRDAIWGDDGAKLVDWLLGPAVVPVDTPSEVPASEADELTVDGKESKVKTAKGTEVVTGFSVVEASRLITSHDPATGDVNPDFPQELQPRDRGRQASRAWVLKVAANLDPEQLGKTRRADTGAPIVGKDRVVESGNGRTMAIIEAYRIGKADEYREWLESEAEYFGLDPQKVKAMKRPVLIRVRTSKVNRAEFAVEANQDDKLAMTATEKAKADANRLTDDMIALMTDNGDLNSAGNHRFLSAFLASLGDAEAAQYSTSDGKPTSSLIARVQAAIFAKAYKDDRLLELTADSAKPEIANIISALNFAAPEFIQAIALDPKATADAAEKLTDSIEASLNEQAVAAIIAATNVIKQAKETGMQVDEFLKQQGLFGDIDPSVAAMAVFISKNNRSAKRMGSAFKAMATFVKGEIQRRQTTDMFGESVNVGFPEIIAAANRELEREYGEGVFAIETIDMFTRKNDPDPAPADPKTEDRAFFMSVIDGSNPEILEPELADKLAQAYERHAGDAEITSLFMQAGNAYTQAMLAATEGV